MKILAQENNMEQSRISLKFKDSVLEKEFIDQYNLKSRVYLRTGIIISLIIWTIIFLLTFYIFPQELTIKIISPIVITIYPLFLFIIYASLKDRFISAYERLGMFANIVAGLLAIYIFRLLPNGDYYILPAIMFVVFIGVYLNKLRLFSGVIAALIYLSGYQAYLIFFSDLEALHLFLLSSFTWTVIFFVAISSYISERTNRLIFKQEVINREQKAQVDKANIELGNKNKEILDSINYAKRIQSAILPPYKLVKKYLPDSFILYKPKDIVAGDFFWLESKDGKILFAAADCTGHGVPGAMVSVICNNGLNRSVREHGITNPGKILDKTREIVIQEFEKSEVEVKDGMDIALCVLDGNTLQYAGAQNPLWIIRKGSSEIEEIKADKQPIGKFDLYLPYTTHSIILKQGDSIYIFSDGFYDQFGGEKGKKFKVANFKNLLISVQDESMDIQGMLLNEAFENWKGELEQVDDVCVIGIKL